MTSKLDGAASTRSAQPPTLALRAPAPESDISTAPESITWTQDAHRRLGSERRARIAVLAYFLSEARGFAPGHEESDWLLAQAQIDAEDAGKYHQ